MDSILELDKSEIRTIKETLQQNQEFFIQNAPQIFEDSFHLILSAGAKPEAFHLIKTLADPNNQNAEALNSLFNAVLVICTSIFKINIKGHEEFSHIIEELGLKARAQDMQKMFQNAYLKRVDQMSNVYDDEQQSMTQQYSKKFPLNLSLQDDNLIVQNSRLIDLEWRILYQLSSKNLNKLFAPRFLITLVVLSQGDFVKGGAVESTEWSSKRDHLRLRKIQFECDHQELTHLLFKIKSACNALESFMKKAQ
eukprot:403336419